MGAIDVARRVLWFTALDRALPAVRLSTGKPIQVDKPVEVPHSSKVSKEEGRTELAYIKQSHKPRL